VIESKDEATVEGRVKLNGMILWPGGSMPKN
jgi:hypothetical protein